MIEAKKEVCELGEFGLVLTELIASTRFIQLLLTVPILFCLSRGRRSEFSGDFQEFGVRTLILSEGVYFQPQSLRRQMKSSEEKKACDFYMRHLLSLRRRKKVINLLAVVSKYVWVGHIGHGHVRLRIGDGHRVEG